jgi:dihydroorotate dehydrogenase electron transfer subunit
MYQDVSTLLRTTQVAENVYTIEVTSESIARSVLPGQFLNIKPNGSNDPLLRRAYSVHRVRGDVVEVIFNVVGVGSAILAAKRPGDKVDLLGPLGVPFHIEGDYERAILLSGGVGIAPMPILGDALAAAGKDVVNIHGARRRSLVADDGRLVNARFATDDGSLGIKGTVVDALDAYLAEEVDANTKVRLFACGPNRMLGALGEYSNAHGLPLEVSLECQMACGIGICQGCPVEMATGERKYTLVCTHGPNYDFNDIVLDSLPSVH